MKRIYIVSNSSPALFPQALKCALISIGYQARSIEYEDVAPEMLYAEQITPIFLWSPGEHHRILQCVNQLHIAQEKMLLITHSRIKKEQIRAAIQKGKTAIVEMDTTIEELANYMEQLQVAGKNSWVMSPGIVSSLMEEVLHTQSQPSQFDQLSDSEMSIIKLAQKGFSLKETAKELNLSNNTIAAYRSKILKKTNFKSFSQLVAYQTA